MMEMDEPIGWINIEKPVAFLKHEATKTQIAVYKKMNLFQRFMIRICFGFKHIRYDTESRNVPSRV